MLLRPSLQDMRFIGLFTGRVLIGVAAAMLVPAVVGLVAGEPNAAAGFVIGACLAGLLGCTAQLTLRTTRRATWQHGMITSALSWLVSPFFGAVPLFLSGHYGGFGDAYFDAMSGFATAGLAVINDLDHLSDSVNLWRHLMQFLGGQGLLVMLLSLFATGGGAVGMYVGEAREEHILPSITRTARFIWRVALTWFLVGGSALFGVLLAADLAVGRALFHAVTLFMAGFDTGGFAPTSASIGIYHSGLVELVVAVLMVAGALSFALHYELWTRKRGGFLGNTEVRSLALTMAALYALTAVGLVRAGVYESGEALVRRGFFHLLSAHTTTGFNTIPGQLFTAEWAVLAPAALVAAMGMGAMAGSTAGGIKAIRLGVVAKSVRQQIRHLTLPSGAVTLERYQAGVRPRVLSQEVVRSALAILLLYLALYLLGALAGLFYGYPLEQALFESTSAAAEVGLSVGVTGPALEGGLKAVYIAQMWIGRLEFIAAFALIGFVWSALRGRT